MALQHLLLFILSTLVLVVLYVVVRKQSRELKKLTEMQKLRISKRRRLVGLMDRLKFEVHDQYEGILQEMLFNLPAYFTKITHNGVTVQREQEEGKDSYVIRSMFELELYILGLEE